jgi:hypothetical protein
MPNSYSHTTRAQFEQIMALRLAETASAPFVRFGAAEIDLYLTKALRTFSALTGLWQDTGSALIPAGTPFIDLPTLFPAMRGQTVLDQDLVGIIEYELLEPYSPAAWIGSEMFSLEIIRQALQRRRDQFLLDTGCHITRHAPIPATPGVIAPGSGEVALDQSIIDIRRAAWTSIDGRTTPLWPSSNWALRGASATWNLSPDLPKTYAFNQYAPAILQLAPPNANSGTLDLLTVDAGAPLDPASGVLLGVPDDFAPFVEWGALADLLSADGIARDYARADYCERMYQLGVAASKAAAVVIDARFNGRIVQFGALAKLDAAPTMRYWQDRTGTPQYLAPAGLNLLAIALPPATDTLLTATLATNAPIPATPGAFIQIPLEYMDALIGYVEHLAMFKIAGREFTATQPLAEAFFAAAQSRNQRLSALSVFEDDQRGISQAQESARPRRSDPPPAPPTPRKGAA